MIRRLKSLELQGYKTFATLMRLEFPGQITAIVGPNGSGKSNIADSVRWVLGEQSYSLLRAKRTEDMIFSGSQQRSRAGMASTTISFNNEDGWLPIDYSEVAISRRAYRDGQNEYLLNGQKVRLKDISELLSQTGLSERNYTIIGQGLVDVALALKPDERRQLFEEAAGIGLYRSRKEDALRRLDTTRKNLDRILDIMTEIRPRLRTLERQAKKFDEYQRLRSDLQVLLLEWYGYHWHEKQKDLRIVRKDYQDQEKRLATLRKKHSEVERKVENAREQLQENRKQQEIAHRELSEYHRQLEGAARQLAIIEERQRSYNRQKNDLDIDIVNIQEEVNQLERQKDQFKAEIQDRIEEFDAAEKEFSQAQEALESVTKEKVEQDQELRSLNNARLSIEKERVQLIGRLEELNNRSETLAKEKSKIESTQENLIIEKRGFEQKIQSQKETAAKVEAEKINCQKKTEEIGDQIEKLHLQEKQLDVELALEETKHSKLSAQLDVLKQAEAALSGYSEGSKSVVEDSRKGRLPAGIEPLSKHIIVDEKFEVAISAALGELTDLLVMPSRERDVVVEYLESKARNRVALVPLDDLPSHSQDNTLKSEGVYGFANELIQVDERYRNLVDRLFSDILIVENRKSARSLQSKLKGSMKVVTLKGLVFQANGVMISGNNVSSKRIGRTRQKNEMEQALKDLDKNLTRLRKQKNDLMEESAKVQNHRSALEKEYEDFQKAENRENQVLQSLTDGINRVTQQLAWHKERYDEIQNNIVDSRKEITAIEDRLSSFETRINQLHEEERSLQHSINKLPLFEMQQSLNHWQTHRIVTKNALESSQQRYEDHRTQFKEASQRLETYQSRLSELEMGLKETRDKSLGLKEEVVTIESLIREVETSKIQPLSEIVEQNENDLSAFEKLQDHSHKQVILAERQYTQLELELSRRKDQLENLRQRIEDDFGLVVFEYEQKINGPTPLPFDDELVKNLPRQQSLSKNLESDIKQLKSQIRRIGGINPEAQSEYLEVKERYEFLTQQIEDLKKASENLKQVIATLDGLMERDFLKTFKAVNQEFSEYFSELFNGGEAKLVIIDEENPVDGGVEIIARLPGRREQGLALLSGGERSLTAVALIFALLKVSPTPFCILDEVDAMLDESNVGRFIDLLRELSKKTQFVIITHNRNTVQAADVIYGVTMGRDSTSQMISLKLEDVDEVYLE